jgi:RNA 3'-terminal phosphate cyclase (ATP)
MATTYSAIKSDPVKIFNIRAKRKDPGLKPQHLTTLKAATTISRAKLSGAFLGSHEIIFKPRRIKSGNYNFDIGTAGSISLFLQCINPILLFADKPTRISVQGGTAVNWSPTIPFLENIVYKALKTMGGSLEIQVDRHGFYPKGGGKVRQYTVPVHNLEPFQPMEPKINNVQGISLCGKLPEHVALRQAKSAEKTFNKIGLNSSIDYNVVEPVPLSPGSLICLWVEGYGVYMGADKLGERGKPAEKVGEEAATQLIKEFETGAHLDQHTTDHMILPASLATGTTVFRTSLITLHTLTAIEIAKLFTDARFTVSGKIGESGSIKVEGIGLVNRGS